MVAHWADMIRRPAMQRIFSAYFNSVNAFRHLSVSETAFRQELMVLALSFPAGWLIASSWRVYLMLVLSLLFVLVVEVLNTGIEASCDAVTEELHPHIKIAKDCGSLAVLLSILIAAAVWLLAVAERIAGTSL